MIRHALVQHEWLYSCVLSLRDAPPPARPHHFLRLSQVQRAMDFIHRNVEAIIWAIWEQDENIDLATFQPPEQLEEFSF